MAGGVELGTGYVSLTVSAKGIKADVEREIGDPVRDVAKKAGDDAGKSMSSSFSSIGGGLTKVGGIAIAAAAGAGLALKSFAGDFEDLALKSNKFALATGVNVDEASRWIEVSGDLGISAETVQGSLGKLNKAAGESPEKFAAIGAEIVRTKSGAVDVNATFLNTVDALNAMTDPAAKQVAAAGLLGRGWQNMAELVGEGSGKLRASLDSVSDAKAINEAEVEKAKEYRASMDALGDSVDDLKLGIGQGAAPVIGAFAHGLSGLIDIVGHADSVTGGLAGQILAIGAASVGTIGVVASIAGRISKMGENLSGVIGTIQKLTGATSTLSAGITGGLGVLAIAASAYALFSDEKEEATRTTKNFTAALIAEADGQKGAMKAALATEFIDLNNEGFKGYLDTLHKVGLEEKDLADAISGKTVPAFEQAMGVIHAARKDALGYTDADKALAKQLGVTRDEASNFFAAVIQLREGYNSASDAATLAAAVTDSLGEETETATPKVAEFGLTMGGMGLAAVSAAEGLHAVETATLAADSAYTALIGKLDNKEAWRTASGAIDTYIWKMAEGTMSAADQEKAQDDVTRAMAEYVNVTKTIPASIKTDIYAYLDKGQVETAELILQDLARTRSARINVSVGNSAALNDAVHGYASGTTDATAGWHWVGENGPELRRFNGGEQVLNHHDSMALARSNSSMMDGALLGRTNEGSRVVQFTGPISSDVDLDAAFRLANFYMASTVR